MEPKIVGCCGREMAFLMEGDLHKRHKDLARTGLEKFFGLGNSCQVGKR